jgi:hypothetical protein
LFGTWREIPARSPDGILDEMQTLLSKYRRLLERQSHLVAQGGEAARCAHINPARNHLISRKRSQTRRYRSPLLLPRRRPRNRSSFQLDRILRIAVRSRQWRLNAPAPLLGAILGQISKTISDHIVGPRAGMYVHASTPFILEHLSFWKMDSGSTVGLPSLRSPSGRGRLVG